MACYQLLYNNQKDFFRDLKERHPDIILKMVKCVLSAVKRKKDKIDIFEITFKNLESLTFSVEKKEYNTLLENCLNDLVDLEEYELCGEIVKIKNKRRNSTSKKVNKE